MSENNHIYLDYQSTTPCDLRVTEKMMPFLSEIFGNAHSRTHYHGWLAEQAIEKARKQVANIINASPKEIIFTSGATESNNLAIKGVAEFYRDKKTHIITCKTEHKCVLESCRWLERNGFDITYLDVEPNGLVNLETLNKAIRGETLMVSVMAINNEIGVIQPLKEIGALCRKRGIFFHTDAAQAVGKTPIDVEEMNIDLLSISGHKLYGPKGIGALYVRRKPRVRLVSQISGGGQERGMRSGTLSAFLCVGLGEACEIAQKEMAVESAQIQKLSYRLYQKLKESLPQIYLNGDPVMRYPGNLNISFAHVEGEGLMMGIKNLSVSSGSACTSASLEPSYVLKALGVDEELAHTSLRIGIGRFTTQEEVDQAAEDIIAAVTHLREMSPLWEMAQAGIDLKSIQWSGH
ncbi:MAG: IscS subfamily cysteine desulfurase [Alphaproteobacteria bacterium]|nr:MAG: IscS subfamily cysteine desulfurase [Alphaproteobacteria bacterium]